MNNIPPEQLATTLYIVCENDIKKSIDNVLNKTGSINGKNKGEIIILCLLLISKVFANEKLVLDKLHSVYIKNDDDINKITNGYKKYYSLWNNENIGDQTLISMEFLENYLEDINNIYEINIPLSLTITSIIKLLLDIKSKFNVIK